jgi:glycosyltransferase involved in cell wall biosynthesis
MRFATLVVANSSAGLSAWRVGPAKGRVVYNAFDDRRLRGASPGPSSRPSASGRFTVVMAARMDPPKDYVTVIRAARRLAATDPGGWRFVLVGDGVDRAAVVAEAADLVADGVVAFPEGGIEVVGHILASRVGLLMSDPSVLAEGCPNSIMEYMACGLPVVCADSGGCRELVSDGRVGFVIPPRDAAALAEKLTWLREHPAVCAAMGAAGRERVETEFTVQRFVAGHVGLYGEAVRRAGVRL